MKPAKNLQESHIASAVNGADARTDESARLVANSILAEAAGVPEAGDSVAIIDDPTYAVPGLKGKVKGATRSKSGFLDVELANGTVVPCMSSLLIKL